MNCKVPGVELISLLHLRHNSSFLSPEDEESEASDEPNIKIDNEKPFEVEEDRVYLNYSINCNILIEYCQATGLLLPESLFIRAEDEGADKDVDSRTGPELSAEAPNNSSVIKSHHKHIKLQSYKIYRTEEIGDL